MESFQGESVALHKQSGGWLSRCTRSFKVGPELGKSEYWRERRHFFYYKHLYCVVARYADVATTALDVGSALPPFINMFDWITNRTILGPYFAGNVAKDGGGIHGERALALHRIERKYGVRAIEADFALWAPPSDLALFDVVICSEVVEHIRDAAPFVQKLLTLGLVVVLSVPYRWDACDGCHHEHDDISLAQVSRWAGRRPFAYDIVRENNEDERLICIFRSADGAALQKPARPGDAGVAGSGTSRNESRPMPPSAPGAPSNARF